jgi:predicted transcriptional regulator
MTDITFSPPSQTSYVGQIIAGYVSYNKVSAEELLELIKSVHQALVGLGGLATPAAEPPTPAVSIKKSIFPDHIVCLEDGKTFKTLKRHLEKDHGMTPQEYRTRWELPSTYPMVAPNYAATRSALAKGMGLGRPMHASEAALEVEDSAATGIEPLVRKIPAGKRGRPRKEAVSEN